MVSIVVRIRRYLPSPILDEVSKAVVKRFEGHLVEEDVGYRPVATKGTAVFVAQLKSQAWTLILEEPAMMEGGLVSSSGAQILV